MTTILAIDPGNQLSAYCLIDADTRKPLQFAKVTNEEMCDYIMSLGLPAAPLTFIEMVASYGMAVGAEVFETCVWIGRFYEVASYRHDVEPTLVKRLEVKMHHCHTAQAKDSNITQALVDRFAVGQPNHGKGTKAAPGWFYGFAADVWAAYALAVYAADVREAS